VKTDDKAHKCVEYNDLTKVKTDLYSPLSGSITSSDYINKSGCQLVSAKADATLNKCIDDPQRYGF